MALREFRDEHGSLWTAWEVVPTVSHMVGTRLQNVLAHGWLCFETHGEKRRVFPVPEGWYEMEDAEIRALLTRATAVQRSR